MILLGDRSTYACENNLAKAVTGTAGSRTRDFESRILRPNDLHQATQNERICVDAQL